MLKIRPESNITWLVWLRQFPLKANSRFLLKYIESLKTFQSLALPDGMAGMFTKTDCSNWHW
jgi:hypothetical protein